MKRIIFAIKIAIFGISFSSVSAEVPWIKIDNQSGIDLNKMGPSTNLDELPGIFFRLIGNDFYKTVSINSFEDTASQGNRIASGKIVTLYLPTIPMPSRNMFWIGAHYVDKDGTIINANTFCNGLCKFEPSKTYVITTKESIISPEDKKWKHYDLNVEEEK